MSKLSVLCVTTSTVRPPSACSRNNLMTSRSRPGSSPEVGSSSSSSGGWVSSSIATDVRLRWPPDSREIWVS